MDWLFGWYSIFDPVTQTVVIVTSTVVGAVLAPELMGIVTWF